MYSVARICPDQSFLPLCHRRRVAVLSMLSWLLKYSTIFPFSFSCLKVGIVGLGSSD